MDSARPICSCCYCLATHLSWVLWIADSAQMSLQNNNKTITAKYLQNDSSISLEWRLQQKTGIVLIISWKRAKHWNDDNNKTLLSLYLLWPIIRQKYHVYSIIALFLKDLWALCYTQGSWERHHHLFPTQFVLPTHSSQ